MGKHGFSSCYICSVASGLDKHHDAHEEMYDTIITDILGMGRGYMGKHELRIIEISEDMKIGDREPHILEYQKEIIDYLNSLYHMYKKLGETLCKAKEREIDEIARKIQFWYKNVTQHNPLYPRARRFLMGELAKLAEA